MTSPALHSTQLMSSWNSFVDEIMADTVATPSPVVTDTAGASSSSFRLFTCQEVCQIILFSPVKSRSLDPFSAFLICEYVDLLTPYIAAIVNASFIQLPDTTKRAIVSPCLKKPGLDTTNLANFRPVSSLSFLSEVVEKAVARQLTDHLFNHKLLPCRQSAYQLHLSMETAMLRVLSDALTAANSRRVTLLGILDMSAAFDCVEHSLLLERLEKNLGLAEVVLRWLKSFLSDRT